MRLLLILIFVSALIISPSSTQGGVNDEITVYENMVIRDKMFEFYQVEEVIFIGNTLINVTISVNEVANVTIIGNTFDEQEDVAILVWNSQNVRIEENIFKNQPIYPIGIFATTGAQVIKNTVALSTQVYNQFYLLVGINIDRSPETIVEDNDVYSPIGDGIYIHSSPRSIMQNNNIHDTGFVGLSIISSGNSVVSNNSIVQSSSYARSHTENIPASDAVGISNSPGILFINNTVDYSDNTGIGVVSSDNVRIEKNKIVNHKVSGVFIGLSSNVSVVENYFSNNGIDVESDQSPQLIISQNSSSNAGISNPESTTSNTDFLIITALIAIILRRRNSLPPN